VIAATVTDPIAAIRASIDAVDDELVRLLNRRAALAAELVAHKRECGLAICDQKREAAVIARVKANNAGPLSDNALESIFHQVIGEARRLEEELAARSAPATVIAAAARVAFQGQLGAFSEEAARLLVSEPETIPCETFEDLFASVTSGGCDFGIVPIANSLAGAIAKTNSLLSKSGCEVRGKVVLPIRQHLIGVPGATLADIQRVESHPVALAQCAGFFQAHPHIQAQPADDTAASVRRMMQRRDPSIAAIAGSRAAQIYGAEILQPDVHDDPTNATSFVLISASKEQLA
jgi:chorismate mutase/prephenate dehydratase